MTTPTRRITIERLMADTDPRTPVAARRIPATRDEMTPEDHETAQALLALIRICDEIRAHVAAIRKAA